MKKRVFLWLAVLVLLWVGVFLIFRDNESKFFHPVVLANNNLLLNAGVPRYLDTVLLVGLEQLGIRGIRITMSPLSEETKNSWDGELKAHVRYHEGHFFLFVEESGRARTMEILAHELAHVSQYLSREIVYNGGTIVFWRGKEYDLSQTDYSSRPWETEAFARQRGILKKIEGVLYPGPVE